MREKLKSLAELQKVDLEIASVRKAAEIYPRQMAELEKELGAVRAGLDSERTRLLDVERQKRTLEQNVQEEKDKVKKWEGRLSEQRSTREYAALAREIDIAKKANQTMAEEIVELGKSLATQRETVKAQETEFTGKAEAIGAKIRDLKGKMDAFQGQVKELEDKRAQAAGQVDKTLLTRYENVRKKKLPALVTVQSGTCQGCNMNVPPQLYNQLKVSLSTDVCPNCHRIICAPEALEAPKA